jgi:hypothetical protein
MERRSDKHNPRLDDEMERETESITRGSPIEARVEESREKEGPGDGEPASQPRIDRDREAG